MPKLWVLIKKGEECMITISYEAIFFLVASAGAAGYILGHDISASK